MHYFTLAALLTAGLFLNNFVSPTEARGPTTKGSPPDRWQFVKGEAKERLDSRSDDCKARGASIVCRPESNAEFWVLSEKPLTGNWVFEVELNVSEPSASGILFAIQENLTSGYLLTLDPNLTVSRIQNGRVASKSRVLMDLHARVLTMAGEAEKAAGERAKLAAQLGPMPWRVRIMKTGATYAFWVNNRLVSTPSNLLQDSTQWKSEPEPEAGRIGVALSGAGQKKADKISVQPIRLADKDANNPVLSAGPPGSWDDSNIFTGSVFKDGDTFYLYFTGRDTKSKKDGGEIGVATSKDLVHWTENPGNPILRDDSPEGAWDYTLQTGGVVRAPDGRYALVYDGHDGKNWIGIGVAFADSPLGPFRRYENNPVLTRGKVGEFDSHGIHLHTVRRQEDGSYVLLYTGYPAKPYAPGRRGDRGGLATSKDLIHWEKSPANPVFDLGPLGAWDDTHVRPKTLVKWNDWYYMFYEGTKNDGVFWWDQDGAARSKDLVHWERFPYNPILPLGTLGAYDSAVTEWPAAIVDNDVLHVFYMCGPMVNMRLRICKSTVPREAIRLWETKQKD